MERNDRKPTGLETAIELFSGIELHTMHRALKDAQIMDAVYSAETLRERLRVLEAEIQGRVDG